MVAYNRKALALLVSSVPLVSSFAFTPASSRVEIRRSNGVQRMIATTPSDLGISTPPDMDNGDEKKQQRTGAMIDLTGIAFSVSVYIFSIFITVH